MPAHRECSKKVVIPTSGRAQHAEAGPWNSVSRLHGVCFEQLELTEILVEDSAIQASMSHLGGLCDVLPPLITVLLDQAQVSTVQTFSESSQVPGSEAPFTPHS